MNNYEEANQIMTERFGRDSVISVATIGDDRPHVRNVDGYYHDGAFYAVTYALSNKMTQIESHPEVAVCGEWFVGHGIGENAGWVGDEKNAAIMIKLRQAFDAWYSKGHVDESDRNTCVLRVRLTDGTLFNQGTRYDIDFVNKSV